MEGNKQSALALRLRALRQAREWTLKQAAAATGVSASTLSKIENGLLSPTYDNLIKIAAGLELDVAELFTAPDAHMGTGRRSLSRQGEGRQYETPYYDHRLLCTALSHKRMMPFHTRVKADDVHREGITGVTAADIEAAGREAGGFLDELLEQLPPC